MFDRNKIREQMLKRTQESNDRVSGGISYRYFKSDKELPLWNPKATKDKPHIIDILPWEAGDHYPFLDKRNVIKKGDFAYVLDIWVHQNIGPGKEQFVCPAKNYNQPCPICEDIAVMAKNEVEWDSYKEIAPKRRCAYNVLVYDGTNDDKVQIWEVSHRFSEKPILLQAKSPRTGGVEPFSDPDIGKSISFEVGSDEYKTIQGHKLLAREYVIPDEVLAKVFTLDEEIIIPSYDTMKKAYFGKTNDDDETKNMEASQTERQERISTPETKEPEPEISKSNANCPGGGTFGVSIDQLPPCGTCKAYDKCALENDAIVAKRKATMAAKTETTGDKTTGRKLRRP